MNQPMNAAEPWIPFDTVCIGEDQSTVSGSRWYETFAALGAEDVVNLFNVRNRAQVGVAYTDMDVAGQMPYGFKAFSLGLEFSAPVSYPVSAYAYDGETLTGPTLDLASHAHAIFAGELAKHCSVRLQINQDEKLVSTATGVPAGGGVSGGVTVNAAAAVDGIEIGGMQTFTNGTPDIKNRFVFPGGIDIPRNHILKLEVKFSTYARAVLNKLSGPGRVLTSLAPADTWVLDDATVPAVCMLKATLFGVRFVQQRNQQHF
jgi:hypothetical protein